MKRPLPVTKVHASRYAPVPHVNPYAHGFIVATNITLAGKVTVPAARLTVTLRGADSALREHGLRLAQEGTAKAKNDEKNQDGSAACCAAQMFLDSGDGVVFKGRVGPWYTGKRGHYHLSREAAEELLSKAVADYRKRRDNHDPEELFIHGRTSFNDDEWAGFEAAAGNSTRVVGVGNPSRLRALGKCKGRARDHRHCNNSGK